MMTFDQCLADLVHRRLITYETALSSSTTPDDFALQFRGVSKAGEAVAQGEPKAQPAPGVPRDAGDMPLELDRRR
jgi:Tfp pilus assembly ATPase PilU